MGASIRLPIQIRAVDKIVFSVLLVLRDVLISDTLISMGFVRFLQAIQTGGGCISSFSRKTTGFEI